LESFAAPIVDHVCHLYCETNAASAASIKANRLEFDDRHLEFRIEKYCLFLACRLLKKAEVLAQY
jgi:hypothetical protein